MIKITILIVDDDPRNNFAMKSYLENREMNIVVAESGMTALRLLNERSDIQLVLMDMMMPEMDGYETIARIRDNKQTKDVSIIAVTAQAMIGDREKCLKAGADEYVSKPVDMSALLAKINGLMSKGE